MELVSIIYDSLLIVFSIISLILLSSFICSKTLICGSNKNEFARKRAERHASVPPPSPVPLSSSHPKIVHKRKHSYSHSHPVEIKKISHREKRPPHANNKIRVISKSTGRIPRGTKSSKRLSIVNPISYQERINSELYTKFSKMSVEYTNIW